MIICHYSMLEAFVIGLPIDLSQILRYLCRWTVASAAWPRVSRPPTLLMAAPAMVF